MARKTKKIDISTLSVGELKTLELEIAKEIKAAEERNRKSALDELEQVAKKFGYTVAELTGKKTKKKAATPPKYQHPEKPHLTWTGRGRQPQWYKDAIEEGRSEDDLKVAWPWSGP